MLLEVVNTGRGVRGEGAQLPRFQGRHHGRVARVSDDIAGAQALIQEPFDEIPFQHPDPIGGKIVQAGKGRQTSVQEYMGVRLGEGAPEIQGPVALVVEEQTRVGVGRASAHHAQGVVPCGGAEIDRDPRFFRPQAPLIDDHAGRAAVLIGEVKRNAIRAVGDGNLLDFRSTAGVDRLRRDGRRGRHGEQPRHQPSPNPDRPKPNRPDAQQRYSRRFHCGPHRVFQAVSIHQAVVVLY